MVKEVEIPVLWNFTLRDSVTGEIKEQVTQANTVMYGGKLHMLDVAQSRTNVNPVTTTQAWVGVGTGSDTITINDAALNTEVSLASGGRVNVISTGRSNQTLLVSAFFPTGSGNGTLKEAGLFVTGYDSGGVLQTANGSPDTGIMWDRVVFSNITKDSSSTLTVDVQVII